MDGITKSSRDSGEDCVPVVYDNCGDNEFLDLYGKCVNETDCEDYC